MPSKAPVFATANPLGGAVQSRAWIFNPVADVGIFIATPLLLAFGFKLFLAATILPALQLIILGVSATGHHLPGMIRAYTDKAIFQRFRWRLVLVPPLFVGAAIVCAYFKLGYLLFALFAWSIWHGLMQVLGFLRIYDAKAGFQSAWTARLDFWMCLAWFIQIILWSPARMSGVLGSFYMAGGPLLPVGPVRAAEAFWLALTCSATVAYAAQTLCNGFRRGYWNLPKLASLTVSIGFWAYCMIGVGNILIGLIMWEIFHDLQYNVFVWKYNHARVEKGLSQSRLERFLFRADPRTILLYAGCIALYGCLGLFSQDILNIYQHQGVYGSLLSRIGNVFAASALIHFYLDGFIWKVRDGKVRKDLGLSGGADAGGGFMRRRAWVHAGMVAAFLAVGVAMASSEYRWRHTLGERGRPDNLADLVPGSGYANFMMASRLRSEGKLDSAAMYYERAIRADTAYDFSLAFLGEIATEKNEWDKAIALYESALVADPGNVTARENLGALYLQTGAFVKAQSVFEELQSVDTANAEYPFSVGKALLGQKRGISAKPFLIRTLALNPAQPEALMYLGMVEQAMGHPDTALVLYRRAVELDSSNEQAKAHLTSLMGQVPSPR